MRRGTLVYPFTLLNKRLQECVARKLREPTEIQSLAILEILRGKNALLIAPTGSGKTEAALLPILDLIYRRSCEVDGVKLVYINPLKALTRDLRDRIEYYATFLGLKVRPLYGDVVKTYRKPTPDIVVITPESLEIVLDWSPKWWPHLRTVRWVIVDEVHELLMSKRGYQLLVLLERLKELTRARLQRVGLSATVSNPSKVAELLGGSDGDVKVIEASERRRYKFEVKLSIPETDEEREDPFLAGARVIADCARGGEKILIFTNSRCSAERLQFVLSDMAVGCSVHHGSIEREEREVFEDTFKTGLLRCLVATKTLELGIDIGDVDQVIQYRSPGQVSALLQRAGRSKHRPGQESECKIVSTDIEDYLESIAIVSLARKERLEEPIVISKPLDVLAKEVIGIALHNYKLRRFWKRKRSNGFTLMTTDQAYRVINRSTIFRKLTTEEFNDVLWLLANEKIISIEGRVLLPGPRFWKVWRFDQDESNGQSLSFSEFFSMIPKKETFTVIEEYGLEKYRKIGELDSSYVYRALSNGMVIRLAGQNWKVVEIDEKEHEVIVVRTDEEGAPPTWKGEGPQRPKLVAEKMLEILRMIKEDPSILKDYGADEKTIELVKEYVSKLSHEYIEPVLGGNIVVERIPFAKTTVFITFMGEQVNRTLAAAVYEKIAEKSLLVRYVIAPHGFAVRSEIFDPLKAFKSLSPNELEKLVERHVYERSPYTRLVMDQLREHFGFPSDETLIRREAARQAILLYYDIPTSLDVVRKLSEGELSAVIIIRDKPSNLAESIVRYPFERPWQESLKAILEEALLRTRITTFDKILEYSWSSPFDVKKELQKIAKRRSILAVLDPDTRGWTVAKIPLKEEWVTVRVPVATKYFIVQGKEDLKVFEKEILGEVTKILKELASKGAKVEVTFYKEEGGFEQRYSFAINKVLPIILRPLTVKLRTSLGDYVHVKVHIKGENTTIIHRNVPIHYADKVVMALLCSLVKISDRIKGGKRQYVFELP
ncbi:MAG: hypothetical protein DRJ51_03285 [Thermoprotei archaeon]|nr:MAG: hypothetical protein DRJ51_03285 [Thermoprotei archaeon]RLF03254.1 MAG: hypothetical protein DRJ59_01215 [Thermoprotei archaeon]